mmetsp:Transcript_181118/g.574647  ORF Transcript_181118/g.574647 Transcript_181118/m.574647 type:complete len:136 (+) Transcript_181118:581-988(+)
MKFHLRTVHVGGTDGDANDLDPSCTTPRSDRNSEPVDFASVACKNSLGSAAPQLDLNNLLRCMCIIELAGVCLAVCGSCVRRRRPQPLHALVSTSRWSSPRHLGHRQTACVRVLQNPTQWRAWQKLRLSMAPPVP